MTETDPAVTADGLAADTRRAGMQAGDLLAGALLIFWALVFWARIHFGFDFSDEGMYLSDTDRLVRGDLPFRDVQENPLRQFDILMAAIGRPFGGFSLVGIRAVGAALWLAQMACLWWTLRRWLGPGAAACAACLVPFSPLFGIWTPGYNEWSCAFTVFAGCALALSGGGGARAAVGWGSVAGIALAADWLCYVPTIALAAFPAAMAAWGRWRGGSWRHPWVVAGAAAIVVAIAVVACDIAIIVAAGLGHDWWLATRDIVSQQNEAVPLWSRIRGCLGLFADVPLHLLATIAMLAAMRLAAGRRWGTAAGGSAPGVILALAVAWNLTFLPDAFANHGRDYNWFGSDHWIIGLWFGEILLGLSAILVFILPAGLRSAWRGRTDGPASALVAALMFLAYAAITGLASTIQGFNGLHIRGAVLAIGAGGVAAWILARAPAARRLLVPCAVGSCAVLAVMVGWGGWQLVFNDAHPGDCRASFTRPPLRGVYGTSVEVAQLEALRDWIDAHEPPEARMIAYHNLPVMYFAMQRLPALDWTWTTPNWSWSHQEASNEFSARMVARMVASGRRAAFCVRQLNTVGRKWPDAYSLDDPLHQFVCAHYRPAWRGWPFEALVPRDAGHPWSEPPVVVDALDPPTTDAAPGQLLVAPGVSIAPAPGGGIVLSARSAGDSTVLCALVVPPGDAVSLRLRLECDDPEVFAMYARDQDLGLINSRNEHVASGWDATFPAAATAARGFAVVKRSPGGQGECRVVVRRLSLAAFPQPTP